MKLHTRVPARGKTGIVVRAGILAAVAAVGLAACGSSGGSSATGSSTPASGGASTAASGTPIKIGNIGNYSGFAADISKATYYGLQAWADDLNARGGLLGHPIQIVLKDDAGTAAKSVTAVKEMVESDHVIAIVGNHESGVDGAWASYISSVHIPVVGGIATGASYNTNPDFFPVTDNAIAGSSSYTNIAKLLGKKSTTVAYCAEVPACAQAGDLMKSFASQLGLSYVPGQAVSASATSYVAQCLKWKQEDAQSVFLASDLTTASRIVAGCKAQNYTPLFVDNPQNWNDSELGKPVWEGLAFGADSPLWYGDGPGTADFLAAMKKYEPNAILDTSTTAGWFAGKAFEAAITAAKPTGDITTQTVYNGLYALGPNFDLGGAISPTTYTQGKPATQKNCAWYGQIVNGKLTTPEGAAPVCLSGS